MHRATTESDLPHNARVDVSPIPRRRRPFPRASIVSNPPPCEFFMATAKGPRRAREREEEPRCQRVDARENIGTYIVNQAKISAVTLARNDESGFGQRPTDCHLRRVEPRPTDPPAEKPSCNSRTIGEWTKGGGGPRIFTRISRGRSPSFFLSLSFLAEHACATRKETAASSRSFVNSLSRTRPFYPHS